MLAFDRNGDRWHSLALPDGLKRPEILSFDPKSQTLWLANRHHVGHFDTNSGLIAIVPADRAVRALGVEAFHLVPSLNLREPPDGIQTNNPRTTIAYGLGATCNGTVCDPGEDYFNAFTLKIDLNGQPIDSGLFTIAGNGATHIPPTPLPEGINTLTARAEDGFGHHSHTITSGFTIDTRPPQLVELNPADGRAVNSTEITIQGQVDEPATVILTHPDGATTVGSENFAFAATLDEGLNPFGLTARDPAGNETVVSLTITLDTAPPPIPAVGLITISGPDNGIVTVTGSPGSVEPGAEVTITNNRTGESFTVNADDAGAFSADITAEPGDTFTVIVKDAAGNVSGPSEITVRDGGPALILHVSPSSGVAPLTVVFSLLGEVVPATLTLDLEGDGVSDFTGPSLEGQSFTYAALGLYRPTVIVTDAQGNRFTASTVVLVEDQGALDALLQSQWSGMKSALQQGDIQGALQFIAPQSRAAYERMFTELTPILGTVATALGEIRFVEVRENLVEYELLAVEDGQTIAYYIEFVRDEDEQWHLKFF